MKKQSFLWFLVALIVIGVFLFFNSQGTQDVMPLSDVFPQQADVQEPSVQYVYMDTKPSAQEASTITEIATQGQETKDSLVETEAPTNQEEPAGKDDLASASFTIQVASFKKEKYARSAVKKLESQGYSGKIVTKDLNNKGIWHRVYVGAFQDKAEARNYLAKIRGNYPDSLIISLK